MNNIESNPLAVKSGDIFPNPTEIRSGNKDVLFVLDMVKLDFEKVWEARAKILKLFEKFVNGDIRTITIMRKDGENPTKE